MDSCQLQHETNQLPSWKSHSPSLVSLDQSEGLLKASSPQDSQRPVLLPCLAKHTCKT